MIISIHEKLKAKPFTWLIFFLLGPFCQAQVETPRVLLWDGTQFELPDTFTELEIQWVQPPYYLLAKAPTENMAIAIISIREQTVTSAFIKEILSHAVNIEEINLESLIDPTIEPVDRLGQFSFGLKTLIMGNKLYLVLAPIESNESQVGQLLVDIAKRNMGETTGQEQVQEYSLWYIGITIAIFFGFLFFILKALKDYSRLTSRQN